MTNEKLALVDLQRGERFQVITGSGEEACTNVFLVLNPGALPTCMLEQTNPDGLKSGPTNVIVIGSGREADGLRIPGQGHGQELTSSIGRGVLETGRTVLLLSLDPEKRELGGLQPPATSISVLTVRV